MEPTLSDRSSLDQRLAQGLPKRSPLRHQFSFPVCEVRWYMNVCYRFKACSKLSTKDRPQIIESRFSSLRDKVAPSCLLVHNIT